MARKINAERRKKIRHLGVLTFFKQVLDSIPLFPDLSKVEIGRGAPESKIRNDGSFQNCGRRAAAASAVPSAGNSDGCYRPLCAILKGSKKFRRSQGFSEIFRCSYCGSVCTTPRAQSTDTSTPSSRRRVAATAPTITALSRVRPTVAAWPSALPSSQITAAASRM